MRLVSYRADTASAAPAWSAGIVRDGEIVDAAGLADVAGVPAEVLASVRGIVGLGGEQLERLARAAADAPAAAARDAVLLGPPLPDPDKILCIGLNYTEHAEETKLDATAVPTVFPKFRNSLIGPGAPIVVPAATREVDYEGELAVVIGARCRRVTEEEALDHVAGVMPFNDVSARDLQMQTSQWLAGKAVDTFAPCGPELVLMDEVADVHDLSIVTRVNGEVLQSARTSQMIFDVRRIIAFISTFLTLEPGDIIATGTPAGVGFTREPPIFLHDGDTVEVDIEGIGLLENAVRDER